MMQEIKYLIDRGEHKNPWVILHFIVHNTKPEIRKMYSCMRYENESLPYQNALRGAQWFGAAYLFWNASLAMLHDSIQIINGWDDTYLNQFRIFTKNCGVYCGAISLMIMHILSTSMI